MFKSCCSDYSYTNKMQRQEKIFLPFFYVQCKARYYRGRVGVYYLPRVFQLRNKKSRTHAVFKKFESMNQREADMQTSTTFFAHSNYNRYIKEMQRQEKIFLAVYFYLVYNSRIGRWSVSSLTRGGGDSCRSTKSLCLPLARQNWHWSFTKCSSSKGAKKTIANGFLINPT